MNVRSAVSPPQYVALLSEALLRLTAERRAGLVIADFLRRRLAWRPAALRAALGRYKAALRRTEAAAAIQATWRGRVQRQRWAAGRDGGVEGSA
jgi:abnormal spindle-like microcephaly-associated protein